MRKLAGRLALAALASNLVLASCTTGKPRENVQPVPVRVSDRAEAENLISRAVSASSEESAIFELGPKMLDVGEAARQVLRDEISNANSPLDERKWAALFLSLFEREEDLLLLYDISRDSVLPEGLREAAFRGAYNLLLNHDRWHTKAPSGAKEFGSMIEAIRKGNLSDGWIHFLDEVYGKLDLPPGTKEGDVAMERGTSPSATTSSQ